MQWRRVLCTAIGLFLATAVAALAEDPIKVTVVTEIEKEVVNPDGRVVTQRVVVEKEAPGTEVIFTTFYENISNEDAENTIIINPMPPGIIYREGSAQGAGATVSFSVDGGKTYDAPANLFVFDGSGRQFAARPQDYTHIRWTFKTPLLPGAKGDVSFRAVLQ